MTRRKNTNTQSTNHNATITSRFDRNGKLRTETTRRDDGQLEIAVSTNPQTDTTLLFVDTPAGQTLKFDGRGARTLYRILQKHYQFAGKSW